MCLPRLQLFGHEKTKFLRWMSTYLPTVVQPSMSSQARHASQRDILTSQRDILSGECLFKLLGQMDLS